MLVVIAGIPGVGKSTVIEEAMKRIEKEFLLVNYGDTMLDIALGENLVEDRDEIRGLPSDTQKRIQMEAGRMIAEKGADIIVDTHVLIKTPKGYLPGLPEWVLKEMNPDIIVLVEADPTEISRRRGGDKSRKRDAEFEVEMEEHQSLNRATAVAYASITGAFVKIIKNHLLEEAVEELAEVLR